MTGIEEVAAIGGLLASAAGAGLSLAGQADQRDAMNKAMSDQLMQQQQYAKQGESALQTAIGQQGSQAGQQQVQQGQQQNLQAVQAAQGLPTTASLALPVGGNTNPQIVSDAAQRARTGQRNTLDSALQGYNNLGLQAGLSNTALASALSQLGGFAQGSLSTLPYSLAQAQQAGAGLGTAGSLLGTLGNLASVYGGLNGGFASPRSGTAGVFMTPSGGMTDIGGWTTSPTLNSFGGF